MLAANTTDRLDTLDDALPQTPLDDLPDPVDVLAAAVGPWPLSPAVVKRFADRLVVAAGEVVVGVYTITAARRDPTDDSQVSFDLRPALAWQWAIGRPNPFPFGRRDIAIKKVSPVMADSFRDRGPHHRDNPPDGWILDIAEDGRSAVVSGPAGLALTELHGATAHMTLTTPDNPPA